MTIFNAQIHNDMELKKSKTADLEKKKSMYIVVGLVVSLSLVLIGFEWTKSPKDFDDSERVR